MTKKTELLIIEDEQALRSVLIKLLPGEEFTVFEAGSFKEGRQALIDRSFDLILLDLSLPDGDGLELVKQFSQEYRNRIVVLTGTASVQSAVVAMKSGVFDFLEKPINPERLITTLQKAAELIQVFSNFRELRKAFSATPSFENLVSRSRVMEELIQKAKKIALTENAVLISGETGTGKELFARSLHSFSGRKDKSFICVNCASIPENLAEAELFGYERGAFTGASTNYPGKFRLGHEGTIFLDEVAELPSAIQGKLLRTLDSGEISPLKSTRPISVDVRVIAATNRDLEAEVALKRFRQDLFYRIAEAKIDIPPLRERQEDILPLAHHFLKIANITNSRNIKSIHQEARDLLINYPWPGNIRELRNTINEISALISTDEIQVEHLPSRLVKARLEKHKKDEYQQPQDLTLKELERRHILKVLEMTNFDYHEAVKLLGTSRATLYRKLQEYNIKHKGREV